MIDKTRWYLTFDVDGVTYVNTDFDFPDEDRAGRALHELRSYGVWPGNKITDDGEETDEPICSDDDIAILEGKEIPSGWKDHSEI